MFDEYINIYPGTITLQLHCVGYTAESVQYAPQLPDQAYV